MKNFKLKRLLSLAFIGCLSTLSASTVFAAAGDTISNTATLTFDVGGTPTVLESSPTGNSTTGATFGTATDFLEDNLINFTVATTDGASVPVALSATDQVLTFTVTNSGNGAQDFSLSAINAAIGDPDPFIPADLDAFNPASFAIFVDSGNGGGYDVLDTATYIDELAPLGVATVYIVSVIPGALANDDLAVMTLVAQVAAGDPAGATGAQGADITTDDTLNPDVTTTEENVFNDAAGDLDSLGAADVIKNGQHSDTSSYIVGAAILTVTKTSATIWDPVNGALANDPKAITGAYTQYTITVANDALAGASGDLTSLGDTLVGTTLDPNLLSTTAGLPIVAPGDYEGGAGTAFRIDTSGTGRNAALNASTSSTNYCTGDAADGDGDGCSSAILIDFTALESMDAEATGTGYLAGELKPNESVVIVFNVIIP